MFRHLSLVLISLLIGSINLGAQEVSSTLNHNPLLGAWEMKEVHWISESETYSIDSAQPGVFLFTPTHYSIQWTRIEEPRTPFEDLSNPTEAEMIAGFRSVVFNAGTYHQTNDTVTTRAEIAKVPGFEGGVQFYRYSLEGDRLTLTMFDEDYPGGSKPEWSGVWETKFVLQRVR